MPEPLPIGDGGLFDEGLESGTDGSTPDPATSSEVQEELAPSPLVQDAPRFCGILTNRWNLTDLLSRRLLLPKEGLDKDFPDLFDLTPGTIPIVETPLSMELVDAVTVGDGNDRGQCFPVFVELSANPGPDVVALQTSTIHRLHFRTAADLENFTSVEIGSLPLTDRVEVSPDLFEGGLQTLSDVGPGGPLDTDLIERLRGLDRQSGAALACAAMAPLSIAAARDVAALMDCSRPLALAPWLWSQDASASESSGDESLDLARVIHRSVCEVISSGASVDDPGGFVLRLIELLEQAGQMSEELEQRLSSTLEYVNSEIDPPDFKFEERSADREVLRGLFMFLFRKTSEHLIPWAFDQVHATESALLTTAYYAGFRKRRSAMQPELRPDAVDAFVASVEGAAVDPKFNAPSPIDVEPVEIDGRTYSVLRSGGEELLRIPVPLTPLAEVVAGNGWDEVPARNALLDLVRSLGWMDLVTSVVSKPPAYAVDPIAASMTFQGEISVEVRVDSAQVAQRLEQQPPEETDLTTRVRQAAADVQAVTKTATRRPPRQSRPRA